MVLNGLIAKEGEHSHGEDHDTWQAADFVQLSARKNV
jgi:hypothetical protein